jgi:hypothetical protein
MAEFAKAKFLSANPQPQAGAVLHGGGKPVPSHETAAEQTCEAGESLEAGDARASSRDRMVDVGRGNQQAGRQGR